MIKIDKRYNIKFSYAGVEQNAEYREANGVLHNPTLSVSYYKEKLPDVSQCKTIDEVLSIIATIAYCGRAEINKINGMPVFYYKQVKIHKMLEGVNTEYNTFVETKATQFFNIVLKPILIKNKWKISKSDMAGMLILIAKDANKEWDNVRDTKKEDEFEYLCKKFLDSVNIDAERFCVANCLGLVTDISEFYLEV